MKTFLSFIVVACLYLNSFGQKDYMKFGEIAKEDVEMLKYEYDSSAKAVTLDEWGYAYMTNDIRIILEIHRRIKILTSDGLDEGNFEFVIHKNQIFGNFKAAVYNINDNQVQGKEYSLKDMTVSSVEDGKFKYNLALEGVKVGSVIEIKYSIEYSTYNSFITWHFQDEIPVRKSVFYAQWFEKVSYCPIIEGSESLQFESSVIVYSGERAVLNKWEGNYLPAIFDEPYSNNFKNEVSQVQFELRRIFIPGRMNETYVSTYDEIIKDLLLDEEFGQRIKNININEIIDNNSSDIEKARAIYYHIQDNYTWNGAKGIYADMPLTNTIKNKTGSCADINLLLLSMLRTAGLSVQPLILSTRNNGFVSPIIVIKKRFNYVICNLRIDGQDYLLDATTNYLPFGLLPERCLNGSGLVVVKGANLWIPLLNKENRDEKYLVNISLTDNNSLQGKIQVAYNPYASASIRQTIKIDGIEKYKKDFIDNNSALVDSIEIISADSKEDRLQMKYNAEFQSTVESVGNRLIFNPVILGSFKENPFKNPSRNFAVDFTVPFSSSYFYNIQIPVGYEVESLPQNLNLELPDGKGNFSYNVSINNSTIMVNLRLNVKTPYYSVNQYSEIRTFYDYMVNTATQNIVLKKM